MKTKKGHQVWAILFLVVLLVIFAVAAVVSFPKDKSIDLNQAGPDSSLGTTRNWYKINEGSYQVLNEFGETTVTDSTLLIPRTFYYFNVLVEQSNGENFIIAVRTYDKTELLREGFTPELNGMISELDNSGVSFHLDDDPGVPADHIYQVCLNDNDSTPSTSFRNAIIFGVLALADLLLIIKLILSMR